MILLTMTNWLGASWEVLRSWSPTVTFRTCAASEGITLRHVKRTLIENVNLTLTSYNSGSAVGRRKDPIGRNYRTAAKTIRLKMTPPREIIQFRLISSNDLSLSDLYIIYI